MPETLLLDECLPRNATAAKCPCGGYAAEAAVTPEEARQYQTCGRSYACCVAAFVCGLCGKRLVAHLEAPEME